MLPITVTTDTWKLEDSLTELAAAARVAPGQVFREETKLLIKSLWDNTPPATNAQGRGAIAKDLFGGRKVRRSNGGFEDSVGIFQRIGNSTQVPPRNGATQTIGVRLGWEGSKTIRIMRKFWRPNASRGEMEAFHKRNRSPHTGRTSLVSRSTIGRWKVQDQMWVKDSVANSYLRWMQSRVGWTKAGFASLMNDVGGAVPNWINRHRSQAGYSRVNLDRPNAYVFGIGYNIKIPGYQRMVDNAVKFREKMTAIKLQRVLDGKATNLGFVRIPKRS